LKIKEVPSRSNNIIPICTICCIRKEKKNIVR